MASRIIETSIAKKAPLTWQQGCFEVISAEKVWRSELAEPVQDGARRIVGASGCIQHFRHSSLELRE